MSKINYYVFTLPNIYSKRNIMLSLLVSEISKSKFLFFMNFFCYCSRYSPKYYRKKYTP